ncbi:lysophospholipase [Phakopsora pachyrhizi]|uniref:Lysophospholipase n=1 Tax=Phakopsora pachyrhizi TaxID=170000 RepID=A0AAV0BN18_PHAPC|nr:lysophospholipase [Phakopsora pachyrhizi]CAH7687773.1 lysophospholipase [Phakopsora pachyrhizi]
MIWFVNSFKLLASVILLLVLVSDSLAASYAPNIVECPNGFKVRFAGNILASLQTLGPEEKKYIASRREKLLPKAFQSYLNNVNSYSRTLSSSGIAIPSYLNDVLSSKNEEYLPRVSLAVAGGAYRGAIFGASIMNLLDGRNTSSVESGTGGLLQTFDYITGLSGSSWLLSSWLASELLPLYVLILGKPKSDKNKPAGYLGWFPEYGLLNVLHLTKYWGRIIQQVYKKRAAGYSTSVVDSWGRILSHHFLAMLGNPSDDFFNQDFSQGLNQTFSDFVNLPSFKNYSQPFPILTTLAMSKKLPGYFPAPINSTQYEFSPYEFGSYDTMLSSFIPTRFLGTNMDAGQPANPRLCVTGFDNAGFMMGASSNLFPAYKQLLKFYYNVTLPYQHYISKSATAIVPNPFKGLGSSQYLERKDSQLELVDGGFGDEVTPYAPLLVKARKVETIIAVDGTGDYENYANGSSLIATAQRVAAYSSSYKFPKVPLQTSTYATQGLTHRPTFFGCDEPEDVALVVWIANSSPIDGSIGVTNTSTLQTTYDRQKVQEMLDASIKIGLRGFPAPEMVARKRFKDDLWPICLACAVTDKSRNRRKIERAGVCKACFQRYCWKP